MRRFCHLLGVGFLAAIMLCVFFIVLWYALIIISGIHVVDKLLASSIVGDVTGFYVWNLYWFCALSVPFGLMYSFCFFRRRRKKTTVIFWGCLSAVSLYLLAVICSWAQVAWEYHLPSEKHVRQHFEKHRADYIQLVTLLQKDPSLIYAGDDGRDDNGIHSRLNTEYRGLLRKIGAKDVSIGEDGSMEFEIWGSGGAIVDDSYMGLLYAPKNHKANSHAGYTRTVVTSLVNAKLPQENGAVATGLYVVPIEPEWFIYRFEYQE